MGLLIDSSKLLLKNPILFLPSLLLFLLSMLSAFLSNFIKISSVILFSSAFLTISLGLIALLGQVSLTKALIKKGKVEVKDWFKVSRSFFYRIFFLGFLFFFTIAITSLILNVSLELFKPNIISPFELKLLQLSFNFLLSTFISFIYLIFYFSLAPLTLDSKGVYDSISFALKLIKLGGYKITFLLLFIMLSLILALLLDEPFLGLRKLLADSLRFLLIPLWFLSLFKYRVELSKNLAKSFKQL
ncbi:MAG: hypothetical protein QXX95_08065 [Nitrososphaerales archaeon]